MLLLVVTSGYRRIACCGSQRLQALDGSRVAETIADEACGTRFDSPCVPAGTFEPGPDLCGAAVAKQLVSGNVAGVVNRDDARAAARSRWPAAIVGASGCLATASWRALLDVPRPHSLWVLAIGSTITACVALLLRQRRRPVVAFRWPLALGGVGSTIAVATVPILLPYSWAGLGLIGVAIPVASGFFVAACVHLTKPHRRAEAILAVLALLLVPVTLNVEWRPLQDTGLRVRLTLAKREYRAQAARLVAEPPPPREGPLHGRIVYREVSGSRSMLGWVWRKGIPARAYGVVYDPDAMLADHAKNTPDAGSLWTIRQCNRIDGPWYWCRLY